MKRGSLLFSFALCLVLVGLAAFGFASEGGGGAHHADNPAQLKDFGWRVLDFSVLFAILFWAPKKADGKGNVPAQGPAILASNHLSFCDSIFLPLVLRRRITFVAKAEYFMLVCFFTRSARVTVSGVADRSITQMS